MFEQYMQSVLDNGLTPAQKARLTVIKAQHAGLVREDIVAKYIKTVADFMNDCYGQVTFDGMGTWTATDGGAMINIGSLNAPEAIAIDEGARRFAYPDA